MPEGVDLVTLNIRDSPARGDVHVPAHERHDDVGAGLKRRCIACACPRAGALESGEAEIAQMRRENLKRFRAKTGEIQRSRDGNESMTGEGRQRSLRACVAWVRPQSIVVQSRIGRL